MDPFRQIQPIVAEAAAASAQVVLGSLLSAIPALARNWGPTLATTPTVGPLWDLGGPGVPRRPPPQPSIGNGGAWAHAIQAWGGYAAAPRLEADVVSIRIVSSIDGFLRTPDSIDRPLGPGQKFCTHDGGCHCPDGADLGYQQIPTGTAYLGFSDVKASSALLIEGSSLQQEWAKTHHAPPTGPPNTPVCSLLAHSGVTGVIPRVDGSRTRMRARTGDACSTTPRPARRNAPTCGERP